VALTALATLLFAAPDVFAQGRNTRAFSLIPITITGVTVQADGSLLANGLVGTTPFTVPLTLAPGATPPGTECPILDLSLGPINLSLLGLNVDTSRICLEITATSGGGLLGNLLCGLTNALSGGLTVGQFLATLSPAEQARVTNAITQVLNSVFDQLTSSQALVGADCNVLNLAVGPLDLSLLGLNVRLDNCADGPVTVDITATPGGGLLGDLLCGLGNILNQNPFNAAVQGLLTQIAAIIGGLLG
jgi:hypothetical protein